MRVASRIAAQAMEAAAAVIAQPQPLEPVEYPLLMLLRDAFAAIADDDRGDIALAFAADPDGAARWRMANGVAEQIDQHLEGAPEIAARHDRLTRSGPIDADLMVGGPDRRKREAGHV